ncbi:Sec-C motif domain protein [Marinilabiliaceae bacterium JC017]|nr:Sec-C motif domain protein [Marinilabiliaceae bacterium JC017]
MTTPCPCGSNCNYQDCCELIITGKKEALTAEELMRSRYTAFTIANVDYLMRSHHSKTRPIKERKNIQKWAQSVQWMGLVLLSTKAGQATDKKGYVEFRALFLENGKMDQIHEKSLFEREKGKWVYVAAV